MAMVEEALKDLQEEEEAEEAAAEVGAVTSTVVATSVAASVGGAVASSVSASVAASAAGAAGAGAGAGTAAGAGAGAGAGGAGAGGAGGGGGGAVVLIFALQKLAVVSRIDMLDEKMPVVTGLGQEFEWANMMMDPPWGTGNESTASSESNNSDSNSSNSSNNRVTDEVNGRRARQRRRRNLLQAHGIDSPATSERPRTRGGIAAVSTLVRIGTGRLRRWWAADRRDQLAIEHHRRLVQGLLAGVDSNSTNSTNSSSQGGCAAEILAKVEKAQKDTTSSTLADSTAAAAPIDVEGALDAKFQG
jgi:hypothetical protein